MELRLTLEGGMLVCRFLTKTAGDVIFADVLLLPNGMSKVGANV